MPGFKCPFCGEIMSINPATEKIIPINFSGNISLKVPTFAEEQLKYMEIAIYKCPDEKCKKQTIIATGKNGYINNEVRYLYPKAIYKHFPEYVPRVIRSDYEEASIIKFDSPKAAATLSRRCLQGMIRDFWKIQKGRLIDEIKELQEKVPAAQWTAIDAVRKIGNIGAHMEKDVNQIIDVTPDEVEALLSLIELLIEKWYINRHDEEELYRKVSELGKNKK